MFCSQILFLGATVAFRTNFLSLADFKSDLSRTNLKLPSSATWPLVLSSCTTVATNSFFCPSLRCGLSDHVPIFAVRKYNNELASCSMQKNQNIRYRDMKQFGENRFKEALIRPLGIQY